MGEEIKYIRCKRCNKILKSDKAQHRGYGEYCWYVHLREQRDKYSLFPLLHTGRK